MSDAASPRKSPALSRILALSGVGVGIWALFELSLWTGLLGCSFMLLCMGGGLARPPKD